MDSPGLTVRPIIDMSGDENEYNEVSSTRYACRPIACWARRARAGRSA
jgi:hypothetical protein